MRAKLIFSHPIHVGVEQRRAWLSARTSHMNPETGQHNAVCRDKNRYELGWRHIWVELEN
jgi:hypothetical protein